MNQHIKDIISKIIPFFNETINAVETTHRNDIGVDIINFRMSEDSVLLHKDAELLKALNILTKAIVLQKESEQSHVLIDVNNYYFHYIEDLKKATQEMIEKVKKTNNPVTLPPQNSFDRMLVHHFVTEDQGVVSTSEGEGYERHIVISLK